MGAGGSGIVFLSQHQITQKASLERAIKFFLYRDDIANVQPQYTRVSRENFDQEIANIIRFNHQNILKVIDGGYYKTDGLSVPYIVTEYVPGKTLRALIGEEDPEAFVSKVPDEATFFDYVDQLLSGIDYLHNLGFYHCDIAPKNVFMQDSGGKMHFVLGDLGAGISLNDEAVANYGDEKIRVIGSKSYSPPSVADLLDKNISIEEFCKLQPEWDVFSTIKTLVEFANSAADAFDRMGLRKDAVRALLDYLHSLDSKLTSIREIKNEANHIHPQQRTLADVPELSASDARTWTKTIPLSPPLC